MAQHFIFLNPNSLLVIVVKRRVFIPAAALIFVYMTELLCDKSRPAHEHLSEQAHARGLSIDLHGSRVVKRLPQFQYQRVNYQTRSVADGQAH